MKKENSYILSINKFLFIYYGIEGEGLYKLTHEQIKEMFNIKSVPNDIITNERIVKGSIILVKDSHGNVLGYSNPLLRKQQEESTRPDIEFENVDTKISISEEELCSYSNYELEKLMNTCKKNHKDKIKNSIIKELHKRKINDHNVKQQKLERVRKREFKKN